MKVLFVCSGNVKNFKIVPFIEEQGESLKRLGIDVSYYPVRGKGLFGYLKAGFKLRRYLKSHNFNLVHAHFIKSGCAAVIGARKIPVVLSLMGSDAYGEYIGENKVLLSSRYMTLLTYLIQPFVKTVISKSKNIEQYVYLKRKSYIIPNGIDTNKFKPYPNGRKNILDHRPDVKRILFLGNNASIRKNIGLVRDAVSLLKREDVELINPFPLPHKAVPEYLNSANVLAMSSFMEGSPNVIKEAMACNCPIVATDVGDVKWIFGKTEGCYIASFNVQDYASKLDEALKYSETFGRTKGVERIKELGLDSETVARRIFEIYRSILSQ